MSAEQPAARLYTLKYDKLFRTFTSDFLDFDGVFSVKQKSVGVVEFRQILTSERRASLDRSVHSDNAEFVKSRCVLHGSQSGWN